MVLTQTRENINAALQFCAAYNKIYPGKCAYYIMESKQDVLKDFLSGKIRTLVIIGRLLEGFDHDRVSVLGIVRNVAQKSRVLFAQFVGRAVRKTSPNDRVKAQIVTHESYDQLVNYDTFEKIAEIDPYDDEEDYDVDYFEF